MFGSKIQKKSYDKTQLKPVLRCSICTGEQVAGFKNLHSGKFEEIMLIKDARDIMRFCAAYDINQEELTKEY